MFDSGVGGLTVARSVLDQLPHEQVLYIGDTANGPYGPRDIAEVRSLALSIMDELVDRGVKLLVIACNTASAAVLHDARERYTLGRGVPVIEVIHPAARTAARVTRNGKVGLIATRGTVDSRAYDDALQAVPGVELVSQACPRFVELAERGVTTGPEVLDVAEEYLAPIKAAGVDTLILGCTHYPLAGGADLLRHGGGRGPGDILGRDRQGRLPGTGRQEPSARAGGPEPRHDFASTGDPEAFSVLARRFLGPEVTAVEHVAFAPGAAGAPAGPPHPPSPPTSHQGSA